MTGVTGLLDLTHSFLLGSSNIPIMLAAVCRDVLYETICSIFSMATARSSVCRTCFFLCVFIVQCADAICLETTTLILDRRK